ncbi:6086_t:CDS:2, partial [Diversispora eburnea]
KIHSRFCKRYKKKTGLDPWINSETFQIEEGADDYMNVFKYTNLKAEYPICDEVHTHLDIWGDWSCLDKNDHYFLNCPFRIDQKKVIITIQSLLETQVRIPNKISNTSISGTNIRLYRGEIKRNEDTRKYYKFLTDRKRLTGEELLRHNILKSGLSTTWLNDLMKEREEIYTQFIQMFSPNEIGIEITTKA